MNVDRYLIIGIVIFVFFTPLMSFAAKPVIHAPPPPPPAWAAFDKNEMTSVQANPLITGEAGNLTLPLHLRVLDAFSTTTEVYSNDLYVIGGYWSVVIFPSISPGYYLLTLSTGTTTLDESLLAVGVSLPASISNDPLPLYDVADGHLMRFTVRTGNYSMGIGQLAFEIDPIGATVDSVTLSGFTDSQYSIPVASGTDATIATVDIASTSPYATITPSDPIEIPPKTTYYFALDGSVAPTADTYSVVTKLLSDHTRDAVDTEDTLAAHNNFVWSPNTFGTSTLEDSDWLNGAGIPGFQFSGIQIERYSLPNPSCSMTADVDSIEATSSVTVSWTSTDESRALWDDGTSEMTQGSRVFKNISSSKIFILTFYGPYGATQCSANVAFVPPVQLVTVATTTLATTTPTVISGNFSAKPTSGTVSLFVSFKGTVNTINSCSASTYIFVYGDNSTSTISVPSKLCKPLSFTLNHTYTKTGTFLAKLYYGAFSKNSTTSPTLLQTQTITVNKKVAFSNGSMMANVLGSFEMFWHLFTPHIPSQ